MEEKGSMPLIGENFPEMEVWWFCHKKLQGGR